jgi:hypothetical protein
MLQYLNEVKVVSRLELFVKSRESLMKVALSNNEEKSIRDQYDLRPDQLMVISIIGATPYMLGCPFLHEEDNFKGTLFYHSHTFHPGESDFESALFRLRRMRVEQSEKTVNSMFSKAGYRRIAERQNAGLRTYEKEDGSKVEVIVLESISDAPKLFGQLRKGSILVVPTEETPAPFISFYRNQKNNATESGFSIIVVNVEDLRVSPFLGYPSDKDLIMLFDEPDLAVRIKSVWGEGEDDEFL